MPDPKAPTDAQLDQAEHRGNEAEQRLNDPLLQEALDYWTELCHRRWETSKPDQSEEREHAYRMLHAGRAFRAYLTRVVTTGKVAKQTAAARAAESGKRSTGD